MKKSLQDVWKLLTFQNKASIPMSLMLWGFVIGIAFAIKYWINYGF